MEAELIPVDAEGRRVGIEPDAEGRRPGLLPLVRRAAERAGGTLRRDPYGSHCAELPGVGVLTFEPGGQLELATRPFTSVHGLVDAAHGVLGPLLRDGGDRGIRFLTRGMDRAHASEEIPLVLDAERYRKQRAHYDRIGPWGAAMMLRSAGLHVNVDLGGRPVRRWWLANRLAPVLTALFANSPGGPDADGGERRSDRAEQWRHLDPCRTGLFGQDDDAPGAYLRFALGAADFLGAAEGEPALPFREAWERGADLARWRAHLTTLFPEVRPRGYLEIRSVDALRPAWYAVPLVVAVGLLYHPDGLVRGEELLPPADEALLRRAGREGVRDPGVRDLALETLDVALTGARALGSDVADGPTLERVEEFRRRFPHAWRDPGDEPDGLDPFVP